jgi:hypothetical protein
MIQAGLACGDSCPVEATPSWPASPSRDSRSTGHYAGGREQIREIQVTLVAWWHGEELHLRRP